MAEQPPALQRQISSELSEATSLLLHASLDIHQQVPPPRRRRGDSSAGLEGRSRRRKSIEDLRVPPGYSGAAEAKAGRSGAGGGSEAEGTDAEERTLGTTFRDEQHPFAGSRHLLRRATSVEDLVARDELADEETELDDGFTSDEEPFRCRPPSIASSVTSQRSSRFGVRLEDRSELQSTVFARDVKIRGFHPVGAQNAGGFVVFDIEIQTREGALIRAHKRYSAFVRLRTDLVEAYPRLKNLIPRLPPKSSLAKFRPSFLERRKQQLQFWLTTVLLHPETGSSALVRSWVLE